ncbi:MAG: Rieske 2Fe-2S domain-containing protein [Actinomycetota bacterium]|nr:Rieske 2Fe-2S domain-containing protein [Actinomycetota bacterium]
MSELRVPRSVFDAEVQARRLDAGPEGVCLVRIGSRYFAVGDRCSHAEVSLSEGEVDPDECWIECWKHGSAFSLVDGQPQSLPATEAVPVYGVSLDGDEIVVELP